MIIRKDVLKLTVPILMEQAFVMSMGMINTMMAGHLGKEAVSAIGMIDSINNILISFFSALAIGGTVVVAHYSGRQNIKSANETVKQILYIGTLIALLITILLGIFQSPLLKLLFNSADDKVLSNATIYLGITLLTYPFIAIQLISCGALRGVGDTSTPMKINIFMNIINVLLSYILMYGINIENSHIHMSINAIGVKGAAIGIAVARLSGTAIILLILIRGSKTLRLKKIFKFKPNMDILKSIFSIGFPASVESLLFNSGKLITQIFIVSLGTASIAANSIAGSITSMFNVPGNALSMAATTMVGQSMGRGDSEGAKKSLLYLTKLSTVCLAVLGLCSFPFSNSLVALYTDNSDIIRIAGNIIKLNAICTTLWSISFVLPAGLKGAGDAAYTMFTAITGMWLFRIILGYILSITLGFGVIGVWMGMYIDWIVRGTLYLFRLKGDKWKKHATIGASQN
jgi:putative MATE family efflux protein